jgi:two-component system, NtrC family, sensor kinase
MPVIHTITAAEIDEMSAALREIARDSSTVEECAQRWTFQLFDNLLSEDGTSACVLVRCFRTSRFGSLSTELRELASDAAQDTQLDNATQCLVLLGSAGREASWNSRHRSVGHRVIPLPSPEMVARSPMIAQLFLQMGIHLHTMLQPADDLITERHQDALDVFYVPDAKGSPFIPSQEEFVLPFGVGSVVGFGGVLPSGSVFAIVMFLGVTISEDIAHRFRALAATVNDELARFEEAR